MSSNTEILIKRSLSTATPASLLQGELAYSYSSNTLFIGTPGGTASLRIGGYRDFSSNYANGVGQYGNTTTIPVITVGANGLITAISTATVSTELDITADSGGPSAVNLLTQTLNIAGGSGLTTNVAGQTITVDVDGTVVRANTPLTNQYIDSNVQISGNLIVLGTETVINVDVLKVEDSLLQLAANNTSDVVDIGFIGHYGDGTARHTGLFRHAADKQYYLFSNYTVEPTANTITPFANSFALSTLRANITANTANVLNILTLQSGSTLYANGTSYFANAPTFNSGATFNNAVAIRNGSAIQFNNSSNNSIATIYNAGTSGANNLTITASEVTVSGNTRIVGTANVRSLYVSNIIYGDTGNNTIILAPSTSYAPGVNDQYIVVDPTAPNHIHLRAGGAIDSSNALLYLGGEETNVLVSDFNKQTYITANNKLWTFQNNGTLNTAGKILTTQSVGTVGGGFSFGGTEGDNDSGMFSPADGEVHFYADSIDIAEFDPTSFTIKRPTYLTGINQGVTGNLVYFNASTGELTYSSDNALTPTSIANGAFSLSIQSTDGLLVHNGAGIQLANGAIIKDTSGDAVAFGQNAGTLNQGTQAVAIGDSAGYNAQGAYGVAIGYGAGRGNTSAIGINTIAIGNKAGFESGFANSIILNASGENLVSLASGFYVNPIRYTAAQDANNDGIMFYNSSTKEVRYSYALDGGSF